MHSCYSFVLAAPYVFLVVEKHKLTVYMTV
jgi:hypothetical protein